MAEVTIKMSRLLTILLNTALLFSLSTSIDIDITVQSLEGDVVNSVYNGARYDFQMEGSGRVRRQVEDNVTTTLTSTTTTTSSTLPSSTTSPSTSPPTTTPAPTTTSSSTTLLLTTPTSTTTPAIQEETTIVEDNHRYYKRHYINGRFHDYWVHPSKLTKHEALSDNHRTASPISLSFTFPFYGHNVTKVTIATGGFLYLSHFLHQWLTATQYAAPLMANFDSTLGNDSQIHYLDNGTAMIVYWENLHLQDSEDSGTFSFQAILHRSGQIIFTYKDVPVSVSSISTAAHPVKAGVSDAYYIDQPIRDNVQRRTIYEYHRVALEPSKIKNLTVIILEPLITCTSLTGDGCRECLTADINFDCSWCPGVSRCSDGFDRHRQEWLKNDCQSRTMLVGHPDFCRNFTTPTNQPVTTPTNQPVANPTNQPVATPTNQPVTTPIRPQTTYRPGTSTKLCIMLVGHSDFCGNFTAPTNQPVTQSRKEGSSSPVGAVVAVIVILTIIVLVVGWFVYAYTHPQSTSGLWLIEHRPSNLSSQLSKVRFWKRDGGGDKYEVDMQAGNDSVA